MSFRVSGSFVARNNSGDNMISCKCPHCAKTYTIPEKMAGRTGRCACGQRFNIPLLASEPQLRNESSALPAQDRPKANRGILIFAAIAVFVGILSLVGFIAKSKAEAQEHQKRNEELRIKCLQVFTAVKTQIQIGMGYTDTLVGSILLKSADKISEADSNPSIPDVFDQGNHDKVETVSQTLNDIEKNLKATETVPNEVQDLWQSMLDCNKMLKEYHQYCSKPTGYLYFYYEEASRLRKNLIAQIKIFDDALMSKDLVGRVETSQGKSGEKFEDTVNEYYMSVISSSKTRLLLQIRISAEIAKLDGNTKKVSFLHEIETAAFLSK
jgi:hypothetical protein